MTLEDAKQFINYNIKEGVYEAEDFDGMSDTELIAFADREDMRALAAYESWKDEQSY
jgi:hypothetical protein